MSIRVHKLAKELGLSSKELIEKLKALKVDVKGHMSALDKETAEIVRQELKDISQKEKIKVKKVTVEPKKPLSLKVLEVELPVTVKQLSVKLGIKPSVLIAKLMKKNIFASINQNLDETITGEIAMAYGYEIKKAKTLEEELIKEEEEEAKLKVRLVPRFPVVTFMGHVDHGKTSLLDYIRKTKVVAKEKGGITQHIGAYKVNLEKGSVTFLDTPGHEAFTAMRARGANVTDIVVLVVAANDGVMPQTKEAINHARAANVPIVVAINKCDLPHISVDKTKRQLSELDLMAEKWGGKTIMVPVSAKTGAGVDDLLEMLLLEAEILELKANPHIRSRGVVIEAKISPGQGVVATLLVKNGTLKVGDIIL
ncbi:MAG: translation initiation factor IF-2 N-terminal domain-containing protein, partial [Candidatus Omnitrophica bacterium]|nr:translation initiation factor IF-2 N-terminal domain-containing protein [Candidatus Omnitrophota bacterium]